MSGEMLEGIDDLDARRAAARSRVYRWFAQAFEYPDEDFSKAIRSGAFRRGLRQVLDAVEPGLARGIAWKRLAESGEADALELEYTRLFDVGIGGPPCPLYGGLYGGDRMKVMEEAVRFYNHFGLTISETRRELPDHLVTQLEFLHFLTFREAQALEQGGDASPLRRAQRDFVARHPGRWLPRLRERLKQQNSMAFYDELFAALGRFLEHEQLQLAAAAGSPSPKLSRLGAST